MSEQKHNWCVGETVPLERTYDITAEPIEPVWHVLTVAPQKERAVKEFLRKRDVFAFYPNEERTRHVRGIPRKWERPLVSGHVYARFHHRPRWHVLKEHRRLITGVFGVDGHPMPIPPDVIRHLQGLTVEAERLREARLELLRIREGDRATVDTGPLSGFVVEVYAAKEGRVWFRTLTGMKGEGSQDTMSRVLPEGEDGVTFPPSAP